LEDQKCKFTEYLPHFVWKCAVPSQVLTFSVQEQFAFDKLVSVLCLIQIDLSFVGVLACVQGSKDM